MKNNWKKVASVRRSGKYFYVCGQMVVLQDTVNNLWNLHNAGHLFPQFKNAQSAMKAAETLLPVA